MISTAIEQDINRFNKTNLVPIKIHYSKIVNKVDTSLNNVKAFLPFIERYSFLDAYFAITEYLNQSLDLEKEMDNVKSFDKDNRLYQYHRLSQIFLSIHAVLTQWEKESFNPEHINYSFEELVSREAPRYLDDAINLAFNDRYEISEKSLFVGVEIRKALLRIHALNNNRDLSDYIGKS